MRIPETAQECTVDLFLGASVGTLLRLHWSPDQIGDYCRALAEKVASSAKSPSVARTVKKFAKRSRAAAAAIKKMPATTKAKRR